MKQHRDMMEREKQTREHGWVGRAGGLEVKAQNGLNNGAKFVNASKKSKTEEDTHPTVDNNAMIYNEGEVAVLLYNWLFRTALSNYSKNTFKFRSQKLNDDKPIFAGPYDEQVTVNYTMYHDIFSQLRYF